MVTSRLIDIKRSIMEEAEEIRKSEVDENTKGYVVRRTHEMLVGIDDIMTMYRDITLIKIKMGK